MLPTPCWSGQIFRNGCGQIFRNHQAAFHESARLLKRFRKIVLNLSAYSAFGPVVARVDEVIPVFLVKLEVLPKDALDDPLQGDGRDALLVEEILRYGRWPAFGTQLSEDLTVNSVEFVELLLDGKDVKCQGAKFCSLVPLGGRRQFPPDRASFCHTKNS